jgi:lysophospholipase L1-like esterase
MRWTARLVVAVVLFALAGTPATAAATPLAASSAASVSTRAALPLPAIHAGSRVVFYGDSYTASVNASSPAKGYATLTAKAFGWRPTIIGSPGSGFTNIGLTSKAGTFGDRFAKQLAPVLPGAALVIVQDGLNDSNPYPTRDAAEAFFAKLRAAYRGPVVLLGAVAPTGTPTASQARINQMLAIAAKQAKVPYISPIYEHWITPANSARFFVTGQIHPNDAGYAYIAQRFVRDLKALGA